MPILGQFDLQRAKSPTDFLSDGYSIARMELGNDVDDQAQPSAAMIDDQDTVIVAERTGELDDPGSRSSHGCPSPCRKRHPASADAATVDRREAFGDGGSRRELIGERRVQRRSLRQEGAGRA